MMVIVNLDIGWVLNIGEKVTQQKRVMHCLIMQKQIRRIKNLEQMFIKETLLLQKFLKKSDSNRQEKERLLVCQNKKISHIT